MTSRRRRRAASLVRHLQASPTASPAVIHPFSVFFCRYFTNTPLLYISPLNISEGGLTKRSQKQTADDLFLIAPQSLLPALIAHSPRLSRYFSHCLHLPLLLITPPPPDCLRYPPLLVPPALLPSFSLLPPGFLHLLPPVCPFIPLICSCASPPFPYPFLSFTPSLPLHAMVRCLSACLSVSPIKGCLRPPLC